MNINSKLNDLFKDWKKSLITEYGNLQPVFFTADGLMYKNNISIEETDLTWQKLDKRIMFVLKDQPSVGSDDDARLWLRTTIYDNDKSIELKDRNRSLQTKFLRIIARLFWGLYNAKKDNLCWYDEPQSEAIVDLFNTIPFAFIESKKIQGGPKISDKNLCDHLTKNVYREYLQREIDILDPNIIVCMGQPVYDSVLEIFKGKGLVKKVFQNLHTYESPKGNIIILYSGHPSSRASERSLYDGAIEWYRYFIDTDYANLCNIISEAQD